MTTKNAYAFRSDERRTIWSMKLSPKLKYLAGLAARAKGKTLSGFIESTIEDALKSVIIEDHREANPGVNGPYRPIKGRSLARLANELYVDSEDGRFLALMNTAPWLATDGERKLSDVVRHSNYFAPRGVHHAGRIHDHWTLLAAIRDGEADFDILPKDQQPSHALSFGLKTEAERIAMYKADPAGFKRESDAYHKAKKESEK
jgi:hypothetical protein